MCRIQVEILWWGKCGVKRSSVDSEVLALGFASDEMMDKPAVEVGSYY
jgi:hypothetical protein